MNFDPSFCHNEREVESKLIVSYLLPQLGYTPDTWFQEKSFHRVRLDFLTTFPTHSATKTTSVVVEAKHPRENLNEHVQQLSNYMLTLNIKYGLLTNGREVRIYQQGEHTVALVFHCFGHGIESKLDEIKALIGKSQLIGDENLNVQQAIPRQTEMKVIAVYHNKGGVGKTTVVVNLAATLSKMGKKVLIIDLDSQANSTFATGLVNFGDEEKDNLKDSYIYHLLRYQDDFPILQVARHSRFASHEVDVIPSHILLMKHEDELNNLDFSKIILRQKLREVEKQYDIVLIDTPPSLNLYARIALITTDYLIIPSDLKPFANEGLSNVREFVREIEGFRKILTPQLINILGVLPTKISTNAKFIQGTLVNRLELIKKRYQINVMDSTIYERDDLAKCVEQTLVVDNVELADPRSIFDFKPSSKAVEEFEQLAQEVLHKIGLSS